MMIPWLLQNRANTSKRVRSRYSESSFWFHTIVPRKIISARSVQLSSTGDSLQGSLVEVLPSGRKLLESAMRCAGRLHERVVKLPHCKGARLRTSKHE